jgi:hypothetical protein
VLFDKGLFSIAKTMPSMLWPTKVTEANSLWHFIINQYRELVIGIILAGRCCYTGLI